MSILAQNLNLASATQFLLNLSRENSKVFADSRPHSIPSVSLREASSDETHLFHFIKEYEANPLLLKESDGWHSFNPYYLLAKKVQEMPLAQQPAIDEALDVLDAIAVKSPLRSAELRARIDQYRRRVESARASLASKRSALSRLALQTQALRSGTAEPADPLAKEEMELDRLEIMITKLRNAAK